MQLKEIELGLTDFTGHGAPWSMMEMEKWARTHDGHAQNPEEADEDMVREGEPEDETDPE